ncbi:MAG: alpha/beta fold hydrolase [Pseudomonadota bacterium]
MAEGTQFSITRNDDPIFVTNKARDGLFEELGIEFADGFIETPEGRLAVRHVTNKNKQGPLIVYCGGNSYDVPSHGELAAWKIGGHGDGLLWDYPGFGKSDGSPSVMSFRVSMERVASAIETYKRDKNQPVVFWGHSLGGFVCAEMVRAIGAADAIVFEATAPSAHAAKDYLVPALLRPFLSIRLADELAGLDSVAALSGVRSADGAPLPLLVLGARKDQILPVALSRRLADELEADGHNVSLTIYPDADHFDIGFAQGHDEAVSTFLANALAATNSMQ